jgi:hypothetical protein
MRRIASSCDVSPAAATNNGGKGQRSRWQKAERPGGVAAFARTRAQVAAKTIVGNLSPQGIARHPQADSGVPRCPKLPVRITGGTSRFHLSARELTS